VKDPFGNIWWIATHVEEPSPELRKRFEASFPHKSAMKTEGQPSR